jgi:hypothetical protein
MANVKISIPKYIKISFFLEEPAYAFIAIYAKPQIAIHQSCTRVKIKRAFIVFNNILF